MKSERKITTAQIATEAGLTPEDGERFVRAIVEALREGRTVNLINFGSFSVTKTKERPVNLPTLPEGKRMIPAGRRVSFTRAAALKSFINGRISQWRGDFSKKNKEAN